MNVIGYVRVSTDKQGVTGLGIEAQEKAIRQECKRQGWKLLGIEREVESGGKSSAKRPALSRALEQCREGTAAAIVAAKLDRLTRSLLDFASLVEDAQRRNYSIVAIDQAFDLSTPHGRAMAGMLAVFAQLERDMVSVRTRDAMRHLPDTYGDEVRERVLALRSQGVGIRETCRRLDSEGWPTISGGNWQVGSVQRIIRSAAL